jgi:uncharacterized protein (TIGR02453 family)
MKEIFNFMQEFQKYHHKYWFSQNKKEWKNVRNSFDNIIFDIVQKVSKFDTHIKISLQKNKKVHKIFRINRDIRFSKNKTPYKSNISGTIALGSMSEGFPGYYISIEPGNKSFVGGGIYLPDTETLKRIRSKIDQSPDTLRKIINKKAFRDIFPTGIDTDLMVVTTPRGYDKHNPGIDLLRLKSFTAGRIFSDHEVLSLEFKKEVIKTLKTLYPLNEFLKSQN